MLDLIFSATPAGFPWRALMVSVAGYALAGVLMVLVNDVWTESGLIRPFVSVGVLSGFTVYSTYLVDLRHLTHASVATATLAYLVWTVVVAVVPAFCGMKAARRALSWWCGDPPSRPGR